MALRMKLRQQKMHAPDSLIAAIRLAAELVDAK